MWEIEITSTLTHGSHHLLLPHFEISQVSGCKTSITLRLFPIRYAFLTDCTANLGFSSETAKCFEEKTKKQHVALWPAERFLLVVGATYIYGCSLNFYEIH